jgi:hypothetical protein
MSILLEILLLACNTFITGDVPESFIRKACFVAPLQFAVVFFHSRERRNRVEKAASPSKQARQFTRDEVAGITACIVNIVLEKVAIQQSVEGIAVFPSGQSEVVIDVVLRNLATRDTWGITITIPPEQEQTGGLNEMRQT